MEAFSREIVASLEGMRVVVVDNRCELHEYNFETDSWSEVDNGAFPMSRSHAERWVHDWNPVDRRAAVWALVGPTLEPLLTMNTSASLSITRLK
jgi:hypothetical protein